MVSDQFTELIIVLNILEFSTIFRTVGSQSRMSHFLSISFGLFHANGVISAGICQPANMVAEFVFTRWKNVDHLSELINEHKLDMCPRSLWVVVE
jgi:hypothetical protein